MVRVLDLGLKTALISHNLLLTLHVFCTWTSPLAIFARITIFLCKVRLCPVALISTAFHHRLTTLPQETLHRPSFAH